MTVTLLSQFFAELSNVLTSSGDGESDTTSDLSDSRRLPLLSFLGNYYLDLNESVAVGHALTWAYAFTRAATLEGFLSMRH